MTDDHASDERRPTARADTLSRRRLLTVSGGVGTALLAGCSSQSTSDSGGADDDSVETADDQTADDQTAGTSASTGSFRLLISDQPVAIDEFDSLEVSFDRARVFRNDLQTETSSSDEASTNETSMESTAMEMTTENGTSTETATETATPTETSAEADDADEEADENEEEEEDSEGGFEVIGLDGATVDLTEVLGEKASEVFDGELREGRYTKIELYAADVVGVVDGEEVEVKIPSGKLQIVKSFEVRAGETVSFVFDINVVKRGPNGYNLLPVISESGVAGEDVEVEEVERTTAAPTQGSAANATTTTTNSSEPTNTTEMGDAENAGGNGNDY